MDGRTLNGPVRYKAGAGFAYAMVALDAMALGIVAPVWPELLKSFVAGDVSLASQWFGIFSTAFAIMQFLFAPLLGLLSDRFGRRPVMLLSVFGLGVDYVVMALAPSIGWLFLGRLVCGITSAGLATAYAYVADITPPEKRAGAFGPLAAMFGLGLVLGPVLGGLAGQFGARLPFWIAAGLTLANGVYGLLILPESLPPENRAALTLRRANPVGALALLRSRPQLMSLAAVTFLTQFAYCIFVSVWVLYLGARYNWTSLQVGAALAAFALLNSLVSAFGVRPAAARFGERRILVFGLLCGATGFCIFGLAAQGWMLLLGFPVMCLWALASPAAQALMSQRVGPAEQGQLQGANASVGGLARVLGPGVFSGVFALASAHSEWGLMGAPFFLASLLMLTAMTVALRATMARRAAAQPAE